MVNYSKGLVYKLCCNDTDITDIYVGSTTNFIRRKCTHKSACNNKNDKKYNRYVYKFIRNNGGWDNWSMILLREYSTTNKKQLERKERKYIEKLGATLNCTIPTRTQSEWYEDNKELSCERSRLHYANNKEHHNKMNKDRYEANKDKVLEQQREYYNKNKQMILEREKKYREKNKETIKQYKNKKIACDCGCEIAQGNKTRHMKSQKHKDLMDEQ